MPFYTITAKSVLTGNIIDVTITAVDQDAALRLIERKYGKLQHGAQAYIKSQLQPEEYPEPKTAVRPTYGILREDRILKIAHSIREGTAKKKRFDLFQRHFRPMLQSLLKDYWQDIIDVTKDDQELELLYEIATNILPKYRPDRGRLHHFVKISCRGILKKKWNRKLYVNGKRSRPRSATLQEYKEKTIGYRQTPLDKEEKFDFIIQMGLKILESDEALTRKQKKEFFGYIVDHGYHNQFLKPSLHKQKVALESCYGSNAEKEGIVAQRVNVTQQTVHKNKNRAEINILKYIKKKFMNVEKTSVF